MADLKISQLVQANVVNKDDLIYLIQDGQSENVSAGTLFASITDPTLSGNIILGGPAQSLYTSGTISVNTTRTDLYGGVSAGANAVANGSVLPTSLFFYTEGKSATGRGITFANGTPFTKTLYVRAQNNKIYLGGAQGTTFSYPPDDWVGPTGLRPFPTGLTFTKGATYIFDVSDSTNAGNVIGLSTSIDGTNTLGSRYTANIVVNGTPGSPGANIVFTVPNVSEDAGGKKYLDLPQGVDGQLKVINLVSTQGGRFTISSNIRNNLAIELSKTGDSAFLMYSGNAWLLIGSNPGLITTFSGTSDDIAEGQKLYFTNARARAAISAGDASITYDPITGTIRANVSGASAVSLANADLNLGNLTLSGQFRGNLNVTGYVKANGLTIQGIDVTNTVLAANIVSQVSTSNVFTTNTATIYGNILVGGNLSVNNTILANGIVIAGNASALNILTTSITANVWNNLYTANVIESASNLYYTNARVYANVSPLLVTKANVSDLTTANVIESASNLYYTNARVYANVFPLLSNKANVADLTTANVRESASNLYYTNARVYANVLPLLATKANISDLTTANVNEFGSNLYYTNARVYANVSPLLATKANVSDLTTANVNEYGANLYFSNARVYANVSPLLALKANVSDLTTANVNEFGSNLYFTNARVYANVSPLLALKANVSDLTTANVNEFGSNLYFTNARVISAVANSTISNLTVLGNIVSSGNVSASYFIGNGYLLTGIVANVNSVNGNLTVSGNVIANTLIIGSISGGRLTGANLVQTNYISANIWQGIYTANVLESTSNLYFTNARVYANVSPLLALKANVVDLTTANVIESASNLYYTNARVYANVAPLLVGKANVVDLTTANVIEIGSNLYLTNSRVRLALSGGTGVVYSNTTGVISIGQNVATNANVTFGQLNVTGPVNFYGNVTTHASNNLSISDNMIYLNSGSEASNPDLGFAGNYNDGSYHHTGFFRDARNNGTWKVFENYSPEPDANIYIDTSHPSFRLANLAANYLFGNLIGTISSLDNFTTSNLREGANLYYTNARIESYFSNITTSLLPIVGNAFDIGSSDRPFRDLWLYGNSIKFSNSGSISSTGNTFVMTDSSNTIIMSANANALVITSPSGKIDSSLIAASGLSSANIPEGGANLYYSNTRVLANIIPLLNLKANVTDLTTANIVEVGNNLYFSNVKAVNAITQTALSNLTISGNIASPAGNLVIDTITTNRIVANTWSGITTAKVPEAVDNLYFTNTRAQLALQPTIAELRASITAPVANVIYVAKNGNDNNTGNTASNALANIHIALARATEWTTVFVKSGDYTLYNQPVTIGRRVGLVGDNLRTTTIRPSQPAVDMFYVNNACYVTGFTFRDHIAPSAVFSYNPDGSAGTIVTSPYIQNSSSITTTGTGMRVDGRYVSGLRSMVCDSYTQTNEGGIGIHMLYRGYTQLVSVFTICCHIAIKCETGGFCSITNSNASFGTYALYADGVSEALYYGKLRDDTLGQEFVFTNLSQRPNYGDSILFATYNQDKCARDSGLIVDSLAFDLAYGGNTQATFAGLQYWAQTESAIPNQSVETLAAINYAKSLALNVIANVRVSYTYQGSNVQQYASAPTLIADPTSNVKVASEFDIITGIITNGTVGVTDLIIPNSYPANTNAYVNHASNLLYRNNTFIASEVVAFVNSTYPGFTYNANTCARDVGFILDTIRFDLLHGGNKQAVQAGTYYYNYNASTTQINDQVVQTGAAYNYIGQIITNVITKKKNAAYNQDKCERDTGLIVDSVLMDLAYGSNSQSIFAGLQYWSQTDSAIPTQSDETVAAINYAKTLAVNIASDTVISSPYQGTVTQVRGTAGTAAGKVTDEFNLIVDIINNGTVGVTDRIVPNSFPANTNVGLNNSANLIYLNKSFIQAEVIAYVNTTYPGFFANANNFIDVANAQTKCSRDVGYIIDSVRFDLLHDGNRQAIQSGTYYYNYSANVTQINDQIVKTGKAYDYIAQVSNKVVQNKKNAAYNQEKCERDTGLIVDSIALDLAYSGNSQSTFAGLQYWAQSESAIANQSTQTIAAINYAKRLASNIVQNITITSPYQGSVTQVTGSAASPVEANIYSARFDLLTSIITNGTVGVTDSIIPNQYPRTSNTTVTNGANLVIANKSFIQAEVIAYVNTTYPGFFANTNNFVDGANAQTKCSRDVGYILDSITFDLIHGGNKQTIQSGVYYYNFNSNVTQINDQIVKTGQAYTFISGLIDKIILGNVITSTYQTAVPQNTTAAPAATLSEVTTERNLVGIINNIITNGPNVIYARTPISLTASTDANVVNATKLIIANRDFIKAETIAYVNETMFDPPYQIDVLQDTTTYTSATTAEANVIAQKISLIKNIITNGPNVAPAKTPIVYAPVTNANLSNAAKILLINRDYIKAETIAYVNANLFDPPYQTRYKQNTSAAPASDYATANLVLQNIGLVTNIISQGPSVAPARRPIGLTANTSPNVINATKLILANRDYIKAEVIGFVNKNWSNISNGTGTYYTVKNATNLVGNTSTVTLLETIQVAIPANTSVSFHQGSYISSSGHTFEYVGSGDTIATALPYLGGIPKQENEITELRGGKVFFTSTDQRGDFRIGTGLVINRVDGTISGRTFNKALFAVMTPYMLAIEG